MGKRVIKSAEDQFDIDESIVDEVSNAEEFADVEITNEDIMDAVAAIDALADAVIEKADGEEKKIDADELLDQITEMVEDTHEEDDFELQEEEEVPEEITNSVVRVMLSENGDVSVEQKPDEVYESEVDGLNTTVFDTTDNYDEMDLDETANSEDTEDDVLIIGNSVGNNEGKKYRKGYITVKSSKGRSKKAWSSAYKKVKKMVGSSALKPVHWVIVSALAKKEEEKEEKKKKLQCSLIKSIKNNADRKSKFYKSILSAMDDEFAKEGQPESETKPETTVGEGNPGYNEEKNPADGKEGKSEGVTSDFGNPVEDPDKQIDRNDEIALPEESIVTVDVPLTNSTRRVTLKRIRSSKARNYNLYKVMSNKDMNVLDGLVVKSGKTAYCFKLTSMGMLACCAKFVPNGKGTYKPAIVNNNIVITRGKALAPVFQNYEKICIAKIIVSSRQDGYKEGIKSARTIQDKKEKLLSARQGTMNRTPIKSSRNLPERRPVKSARMTPDTERRIINSSIMARRNERRAEQAIQSKLELQKKFEQEERQRLFQSSQTQLNEEKIAIKSANTRNAAALSKLYDSMF